jgi:hypothetical protein
MTRSNVEWCNDCVIANDNVLATPPANPDTPLHFLYPNSEPLAAKYLALPWVIDLASAQPLARASVVIPYSVNLMHWHQLFVCFPERTIYHFEGFGNPLSSRDVMPTAMRETFGDEWTFVPLRGLFQVDGCACGIWLQVARDVWVRYMDSDQYGAKTFQAFLTAELAAMGVKDVDKCRGQAKRVAERANQAFILEQRAEMRGRLVQMAMEGAIVHGQAQLPGFSAS